MKSVATNCVDVWIVKLADGDVLPENAVTGVDNKMRLSRILPPARRRRFVFRKSVEDYVLKHYAADYRIHRSETGKPFLSGSNTALHFSASVSCDVASLAVSGDKVGVDIESAASKIDLYSLCDHYAVDDANFGGLGPWRKTAGPWRKTAGMWRWCRFEAALKLHGQTLLNGLSGHAPPHAPPYAHDMVIAMPDFVCVVAKSHPFSLGHISVLPFDRIVAHVA